MKLLKYLDLKVQDFKFVEHFLTVQLTINILDVKNSDCQ